MDHAGDAWLIGRLRGRQRRRLEDLLFERKLRDADVSGLVEHIAELEAQIAALRARLPAGEDRPPGHVLFVPSPDGYAIVEAHDAPPPVGQLLLLDGGCFRVHRLGRSPFPRDRRPCLFLEASGDQARTRSPFGS